MPSAGLTFHPIWSLHLFVLVCHCNLASSIVSQEVWLLCVEFWIGIGSSISATSHFRTSYQNYVVAGHHGEECYANEKWDNSVFSASFSRCSCCNGDGSFGKLAKVLDRSKDIPLSGFAIMIGDCYGIDALGNLWIDHNDRTEMWTQFLHTVCTLETVNIDITCFLHIWK